MSDDADRADAYISGMLHTALTMRRQEGPHATGRCLWCGEPLADGRRWCGPDCRDDWESHHAANRRR